MPTLEPSPEVGHWARRLAGLAVLGLGVGILVDSIRSVLVDPPTSWGKALWAGVLLLPVCLLAIGFGYRLLFNRPNPYGSIMGPTAWRICGLVILLGTGILAVVHLKSGGGLSWRLIGMLALAGACVGKAEHMVRRGEIAWDRSARSLK